MTGEGIMVSYKNGFVPETLLVTFHTGYSPGEGNWKHQLSPGTYAKHLALVELARKNTGRTLSLSSGWSGYRPYAAQVYARNRYGNGAASPGTSSHGGFWEGQQTLAMDYGNWSYVYGGSRAAFFRDARAVGLEPGLIVPARGYPDEPWHVVDKSPWAVVGSAAGGASGIEEADMPGLLDTERKLLDEIHAALGAGGANAATVPESGSILALARAIKADVNGAPNILARILGEVNGLPGAIAEIRAAVGVSDAQVRAIADAVVKQIGTPTVKLDYAAIAKAVNDDAARRLTS